MTYRNILVAVDTTDEAEEVVKAARELADENDVPRDCLLTVDESGSKSPTTLLRIRNK